MKEALLILFAAGVIYYVSTRVAPQNLIFRLKKDEEPQNEKAPIKEEEIKEEQVLLKEGQDLFNRGEIEAAEKKFLAAIKIDPAVALSYQFLGMIYLRQKIYKGAIASLEKAVKLDPLNDTAFNNLGLAYYNEEKNEEAIKNFEKSISLNDKIAHRFLNLALAYQKNKDLEKAAVALERAVKIHENVENLTFLAKNYLSMGEKKLASKAMERLLEIDPKNSWAKRQIAGIEN